MGAEFPVANMQFNVGEKIVIVPFAQTIKMLQ